MQLNPTHATSAANPTFEAILPAWTARIQRLARRHATDRVRVEELEQEATVALWQATLKFSSDAGVPFEHYANRAMRNEVVKASRRGEVAEALDKDAFLADGTDVADNDARGPLEHACAAEEARLVRSWLNGLRPSCRTLIESIYRDKEGQRTVAQRLGVSQQRISTLHRELLSSARVSLAAATAA